MLPSKQVPFLGLQPTALLQPGGRWDALQPTRGFSLPTNPLVAATHSTLHAIRV